MQNIKLQQVTTEQERIELYYQRWLVLRAPLKMPLGSERDRYDNNESIHLIAIASGNSSAEQIVGSARLRSLSSEVGSIAYVAVLPEFQQQGIGSALIQYLIELAKENSFSQLRVMARTTVIHFYQRFGFTEWGEPINHLNIPHVFMHLDRLS
jgi:predicted GNAT family N-acyltransferase